MSERLGKCAPLWISDEIKYEKGWEGIQWEGKSNENSTWECNYFFLSNGNAIAYLDGWVELLIKVLLSLVCLIFCWTIAIYGIPSLSLSSVSNDVNASVNQFLDGVIILLDNFEAFHDASESWENVSSSFPLSDENFVLEFISKFSLQVMKSIIAMWVEWGKMLRFSQFEFQMTSWMSFGKGVWGGWKSRNEHL